MARPRPATRLLRKLRRAGRDADPVRLRRSRLRGADDLDGFVVAATRSWTLLARLDPAVVLDGYVVVRTADITSVRRRGDLPVRVLRRRGQWPPPPPPFDPVLATASTIIAGASDVYPLLTIRTENAGRTDRSTRHVGRVVRCTERKLRLHEVTRKGRWRRRTATYRMKALTSIGFGGRYEQALDQYTRACAN